MLARAKSPAETDRPDQVRLRAAVTEQRGNLRPQSTDGLLRFQRGAGNLATQKLIKGGVIQPKLNLSQPEEAGEREADRVAEQIIRTKPGACHCGGSCSSCASGGEASVKLKSVSGIAAPVPSVHESFLQGFGPGRPLDPATRGFFEARFGRDFGGVRVHAGSEAAESARAVYATAFTVGQDIVFGKGAHAPGTNEGDKLMAHELTHVVQQNGRGAAQLQRTCAQSSDESFYQSAGNYCSDTGFSGVLHPGQRCYREVPNRSGYFDCPPGDQVCFDERGGCHDSYDRASTVESKNSDGSCNLHGLCFIKHAALDIIPGIFQEGAEEQAREHVECLDSCANLEGFSKVMCETECRRSSRLLP